jgi:hypothetical protein
VALAESANQAASAEPVIVRGLAIVRALVGLAVLAVSRAGATTPASTAAVAPAVLGALDREATAAEGCAVAASTAADAVDSGARIEAAAIAVAVVAGGAPT